MINGVINIYKEKGFTSHDVVAKLRGIMKQKKIGHTGTLDPEATGVLPVCLGNATRLCDMLVEKEKEYVAKVRLGVSTDTQDLTGKILKTAEVTVTEEDISPVLEGFIGNYEQIPPMFSAVKVNGKKLYELARQGQVIERKPRPVTIYGIELMAVKLPFFTIRVRCSKGTYIRTLCHDIGIRLNCPAVMAELERIRSGEFRVDTALTLKEVEQRMEHYRREETTARPDFIRTVDSLFPGYPPILVGQELEKFVCNGNPFPGKKIDFILQDQEKADGACYRIYTGEHKFMGIYEYRKAEGMFYPVKMFMEG